ncbi:uncharacterized protein LOC122069337 [Macadamia integrifolia]|uniref:uncharacterized protein LOC122069337 n=1 Tax=Macadamia integrifolia TaxID=60698 RepID=UPI001C4E7E27|nr:uncharacterized protein LOC122069337 [Macadamia integrifolia]
MAASMRSFFYAILILNLLGKGLCQCSLKSLTVSQDKTGKMVGGEAEYEVTVSNTCYCTQTSVTLSCPGFSAVKSIDTSVLTVNGNTCTLTQPLYGSKSVSFKYASGTPFTFTLASSQIACS